MVRFLLPAMQFVLIVGKLFGLLDISWLHVFIPTYISLGICFLCVVIITICESLKKRPW